MGPLTDVVVKTVSSLMADENVVGNPKLFMLCHTSSDIFGAKNISEYAILHSIGTSGFKTEASFNEKISFMRSCEKVLKSLNNSIVRKL